MDHNGKLVRKYSSKKKAGPAPAADESPRFRAGGDTLTLASGLNRFTWDLRYASATKVPHHISWGGQGEGPLALPGNYQVRLTVAGKSYTQPLVVKLDPRLKVTQADLAKQLDLATQIRDRVSQAHEAVNQIRSVREQIKAMQARLGTETSAKEVLAAATGLDKKITSIEQALIQVKAQSSEDNLNYPIMLSGRLSALESVVESAEAAPTTQSYTTFKDLSSQLDAQLAQWKQAQQKDLMALNKLVQKAKLDAVAIPAPNPAE